MRSLNYMFYFQGLHISRIREMQGEAAFRSEDYIYDNQELKVSITL